MPQRIAAAVAVISLTAFHVAAVAQPTGATVVHGQAQVQQQGNNLLVTTQNGAGTQHSTIDWRSFSVPAGSTTHFAQPGADSTSINRVTGHRVSEIFGTLSSNGRLVLVNPAGIAVGAGALVDTAGFTASTLRMSDEDAAAGRMRFSAPPQGAGALTVDGRVLARNGDVVLLASKVSVGSGALLQAPQGTVIVAAGQKVELTGRGLEGIVLELAAPDDEVLNLGRLEGDAVGLFAAVLRHSGMVQANTVVMKQGGVTLTQGPGKGNGKGNGNAGGHSNGNGNGNGNGKIKGDDTTTVPSPAPVMVTSATAATLQAEVQNMVMANFQAPAVTPAQAMDPAWLHERLAFRKTRATETTDSLSPLQCTP